MLGLETINMNIIYTFKVLAVLICMAIVISKVDVDWADVFRGYLPSKYIFSSGSLFTCELL